MKPQTRQALLAINREFYDVRGDAFAATRNRPWAGWTLALPWFPPHADILDLGCGNGRLAAFLSRSLTPPPRSYLGIDDSAPLLRIAGAEISPPWARFQRADLLGMPLGAAVTGEHHDVVCAFGLLHHVPGADERLAFIDAALDVLRPGGRLLVSVWRFDRHPRFDSKCLDVARVGARLGITPEDLEPGDHLMSFGGDRQGPPRYCHFPTDDEVMKLSTRPAARCLARYRPKQGDTFNEYLVLERCSKSR